MVICFSATSETKRALDALLSTGQFKDISEAISMALVNYDVLQRSLSSGEPTLLARGTHAETTNIEQPPQQLPAASLARPAPSSFSMPQIFLLDSRTPDGIKLAETPTFSSASKGLLPPSQWLFGQFNRFLPAKASCRALLNLLQDKPGGITLDEAAETISKAACWLGDWLNSLDQGAGHSRENSFAAAFPTTGSNGELSRLRFSNQFVGSLYQPKSLEGEPKETKFTGLPAALRFMVCANAKAPSLRLTAAGAEFAMLPNPILDCSQAQPDRKLGQKEIDFLLPHIRSAVPEERSAYSAILDAIDSGANTPDAVDAHLRQVFRLPTEQDMTKTFLTTQRTGAIARLVELGLLAREKQGLRVRYFITTAGKDFRTQIRT